VNCSKTPNVKGSAVVEGFPVPIWRDRKPSAPQTACPRERDNSKPERMTQNKSPFHVSAEQAQVPLLHPGKMVNMRAELSLLSIVRNEARFGDTAARKVGV